MKGYYLFFDENLEEILRGLKYLKIIDGVRTPPTGDRNVRL
jgi:hypothetical protein